MKRRKERSSWSSYLTGLQPNNQFKTCEIEGDNSHRYAESNKTVIPGIETMISEQQWDKASDN